MAVIAFISPYLDWAMTLRDARQTPETGAATCVPVYFSGKRDALNLLLQENDVQAFVPTPGADPSSDDSGLRPILREAMVDFHSDSSEEMSGFYFMDVQDLRKMAEQEDFRDQVESIGIPVQIAQDPSLQQLELPTDEEGQDRPPIVAVIDEGIAYLNARFRKGAASPDHPAGRTRFLALWQQAIWRQQAQERPLTRVGRVLDQKAIEQDLARLAQETEFDIYHSRNRELFADHTHRSTEQAFSHGTAILDLAAGADMETGAEAADILAVQLPPEVLEDTSGTHLPFFLLSGLEWLLTLALRARRPIIINISLGYPAGPKSGAAFLERMLRHRIARFNRVLPNPGGPAAQLVFAYGNSYRDRLGGRFTFTAPGQAETIDWLLQPADPTPSFVEIHLGDGAAHRLEELLDLRLTSPDGTRFSTLPPLHHYEDLRAPGESSSAPLIGRIYQDRVDGVPRLILALAPTEPVEGPGLRAQSGRWRLEIRSKVPGPISVILQVQRDDTAAGFARGGRQSVLDHPNGYGFDPRTGEFEQPDGGPGLTRTGSNSALMAKGGAAIYLAGAIEPDPQSGPDQIRPTRETAASDGWSQRTDGPGPTHSIQTEDGPESPGVLASGTFSGTTVAVNGTSVAAAKLTRDLSGVGPDLTPLPESARSNRIGARRIGPGGARPRHPEG